MIIIEFSNVSYKFQGYKEHVLNSLSFKIKKNQSIGIVGKTGSGKNHIIRHFSGTIKTHKWENIIDNVDYTSNLNQKGWHKKLVISQM